MARNEIVVKTSRGNEVIVSYMYEESWVKDSKFKEDCEEDFAYFSVTEEDMVLNVNGKRYAGAHIALLNNFDDDELKRKCENAGVNKYLISVNNNVCLRIVLPKDQLEALETMIAEAKKAGSHPKVTAIREAKEAKQREEDAECAKRTIEMAEEIIARNGKLMTDAQAREWAKKYNEVVNEGGSGYIPTIITEEMYEAAKKKLAR